MIKCHDRKQCREERLNHTTFGSCSITHESQYRNAEKEPAGRNWRQEKHCFADCLMCFLIYLWTAQLGRHHSQWARLSHFSPTSTVPTANLIVSVQLSSSEMTLVCVMLTKSTAMLPQRFGFTFNSIVYLCAFISNTNGFLVWWRYGFDLVFKCWSLCPRSSWSAFPSIMSQVSFSRVGCCQHSAVFRPCLPVPCCLRRHFF